MSARSSEPTTQNSDETIETLIDRLVALSIRDRRSKSKKYFAKRVEQTDVDNWNDFMRRSNEYHSVGVSGEESHLKPYMGDLKKQYERCVRAEAPPSGAVSWEEYFETCYSLAQAVLEKNSEIARLRVDALRSPGAQRAVEKGLFSRASWFNHVDQVIGYSKATLDVGTELADLILYRGTWKAQRAKFQADPKGYKFSRYREEAYRDQLAAEGGWNESNELRAKWIGERAGRSRQEEKEVERKRAEHAKMIEEKYAVMNRELDRMENEG